MKTLFLKTALCLLPALACAQYGPLNPADLMKPLSDSWPTFCGDYTCQHYSHLTLVNQSNVKGLSLAWVSRLTAGVPAPAAAGGAPGGFGGPGGPGGGGGGRGGGGAAAPIIIGGEGPESTAGTSAPRVSGSILMVDGVLYLSAPNNAWAVDARDGRQLWHYFWKTLGGNTIGNRGLGMYGSWLYMETADDHLVCLDAKTGKERWHKVISDLSEQYFSTAAPVVIGNHVLVGTSDDLDAPGYLTSYDPETGDIQWKHYDVPMNPGDPGLDTWPSLDAARHGGAQPWIPGAYDPETHLYVYGTGNPTPGYTNGPREGDNLFTCSMIALDVDTGKMKWYYQTSPHDTHDWDSTQIPMFVDAMFNGKMRKMVMQATRNGYFFVLDRLTGEHLVTSKFSAANWASGIDAQGRPVRDPLKDPIVEGALVSGTNVGSTIWIPPAWYPDLGYFILRQNDAYAMYYLTETDPRGAMGLGGKEEDGVGSTGSYITAIDYRTGKVVWRRPSLQLPAGGGLLTTAGKLLFAGDGSNFVAYDPANGKPLWHSRIGATSNAPETYMLDGHQYVTVFADDSIFSFVMN